MGIKCSTERERANLSQLIDFSEYLSVIFCCAVGGVCFLRKKESYICLEVTSEIGTAAVSFNVWCGGDGSYFIFTDRRSNNRFPVRWKKVNDSHNKETLFRGDRHIRVFVQEKVVIRNKVTHLYDSE